MRSATTALLFCLSAAPPAFVAAQPAASVPAAVRQIEVQDIRSLMVEAIDSPSGQARAQLVGTLPDAVTQHFRASSPILLAVTTERRYRQPGCSRLKLSFAQEGVHLPGLAQPERRGVEVGMNYCRDGRPPQSLE